MSPIRDLSDFVKESNAIEGIHRAASPAEIIELDRFLDLPKIEIEDLIRFVYIYQPNAVIRDRPGLDVRVGDHIPPPGGVEIKTKLQKVLDMTGNPYQQHQAYETLHPFTDGNGRSGRALWLWAQRGYAPLGFLHHWYYQSLSGGR